MDDSATGLDELFGIASGESAVEWRNSPPKDLVYPFQMRTSSLLKQPPFHETLKTVQMCGGIGELIVARPIPIGIQLVQFSFRVIHTLLARTSHSHRSQ